MRMKKTIFVLKKPSIHEIIQFAETARSFSCHIMACHDKMTARGRPVGTGLLLQMERKTISS